MRVAPNEIDSILILRNKKCNDVTVCGQSPGSKSRFVFNDTGKNRNLINI